MDTFKKIFCAILIIGALSHLLEGIYKLSSDIGWNVSSKRAGFSMALNRTSTNAKFSGSDLYKEPDKSGKTLPVILNIIITKTSEGFVFFILALKGTALSNSWYIWALGIGIMCATLFLFDIRRRFSSHLPMYLWSIGFIVLPIVVVPAYLQFRPSGDFWRCEHCGKKKLIKLQQCPFCSHSVVVA